MSRSVDEWIGKTDDTPAPPRVRLRVFEAHGGICFLSGVKIRAGMRWELHHKVALIRGGQNRESNLVPVLYKPHKAQTALDVAEKATVYRKRSKHLGILQTIGQRKAFRSKFKKKVSGEVVLR